MSNTETKIPKAYYYSVEGLFEEDAETLKKFTTPSFGRSLTCEFDLEGIGNSTALSFYLNNEEYQDIEKWPLTFKFYETLKSSPVDVEMNLSYSPCFLSTPKPITVVKETPVAKPKRQRKPKEEVVVQSEAVETPQEEVDDTATV